MNNEKNKILEGLKIAIQMEIDGKEYYLKTSQKSSNTLGKKLLESLAAEEDIHRQKFEEIYNVIKNNKDWPVTDFQPDKGKKLKTLFSAETENIDIEAKSPDTELNAIQTAMDMEKKSYDFYHSQAKNASYDAERNFYQLVAAEEREHHLVLLDYYEYIEDPAAWFATKEHSSLDGI